MVSANKKKNNKKNTVLCDLHLAVCVCVSVRVCVCACVYVLLWLLQTWPETDTGPIKGDTRIFGSFYQDPFYHDLEPLLGLTYPPPPATHTHAHTDSQIHYLENFSSQSLLICCFEGSGFKGP